MVQNTEVRLTWGRPYLPTKYTRNDIWYIVRCEMCASGGRARELDADGYSAPIRLSDLPFRVRGLRAETEYYFEVLTVNSLVVKLATANRRYITVKTENEGSNFGRRLKYLFHSWMVA